MAKLLILKREEVESLITLDDVIPVVEAGFRLFQQKKALAFPVVRERVEVHEGIFGIKSGYVLDEDLLGFKAGGFWVQNPKLGLLSHQSIIVLFDPKTGLPLSVMDGNFITIIRTGAVGAIAAKWLARKNSKVAAIIGCGTQGKIQLRALAAIFPLKLVRCYDQYSKNQEAYIRDMTPLGICVEGASSAEEAIRGADVIVTATPSESWIISADWVNPGVHINAIGADTRGKQELDPRILGRARLVVDSVEQSGQLGEAQHLADFREGRKIYAELGEIVYGSKPGREGEEEITVFDATGIAFQDLVTAGLAYETARRKGLGVEVEL